MGWDAWATKDGKQLKINWDFQGFKSNHLKDFSLNQKFKKAAKTVKEKTGGFDGCLDVGGLDCSDCAKVLEKATGMDCWFEDDLTPKQVKKYYKNADWGKAITHREFLEYASTEIYNAVLGENIKSDSVIFFESAKEFLRVCAENNLGIHFDW